MPFVLLHGALLWKLAIVMAVALVFGAVWIVRRISARRWAHTVVHCLDIATHARVIRGVLGGGGATTTGETLERDRRVWIETADDRYELVGDICVLAGSTVRGISASVRPGDPVVAHGTITRSPGGVADYRTDVTAFALAAEPDAPILLAARRPVVGLTALSRAAKLWITGATTVIAFGAMCALGTHWHEDCLASASEGLTNMHACVLASATPMHDDTSRLYDRTWERDQLLVARYLGDCVHMLDALDKAAQWEELVVTAERCGAPEIEQRALVEVGRFAEAAALGHTHSGVPLGKIYIWAHRWEDAADQAFRLSRESRDRYPTLHWFCLSRLLHHYAGAAVTPDEFADGADCPAMREEALGRDMPIPSDPSASWGPSYECPESNDPTETVRSAMKCERYGEALRDRRVEVALARWTE